MDSRFQGARDALMPFLPTADGGLREAAWPLPVEGPLADLDEALERGMPGLAFVNVREASEGVVRVAWTLLVHEVLSWAPSLDSLQALPDDARSGARAVLDSALSGAFTFGGACFVAAELPGGGIAAPLRALAPHLAARDASSASAAWHGTLADDRALRKTIRALWAWRNHRFAHGFVGDADAYAALFDARLTARSGWERRVDVGADGSPLPALLSMLRGAETWLAVADRATRALGWPTRAEARAWSPEGTPTPAPEPVAWRGGEHPLYLWNRATPHEVRAVDVQQGHERQFPLPASLAAVALATREALDAAPTPFAPYWGEDSATRLQDDPRRVQTKALRDAVLAALDDGHRRVAVTGAAGAGKTYLTLAVGEALEDDGVVVLRVAAGASGAMDSDRLPHLLQDALERGGQRLRAVELDDRETRLFQVDPSEPERVARWWRELARQNPGRRFVLVLDGLDEWHAAGAAGVGVLPPVAGGGAEAFAVILGFRSRAEVAPWLWPALDEIGAEATVDVHAWLQTTEGVRLLKGYLARQHPTVPEARHDAVIERADGRFLWVFHYARGLAAGFLDGDAATSRWPAPEAFYGQYLAWLEVQMGGAPGYVRCLRRTLLTFALARMPINDPTLAWLWEVEDAADDRPPEPWLDWFEPVLADLRDFLVRGPVALDGPTEVEQRAALVTILDANRDSRFAVCRGIAHATLATYLSGDDLPPSWRAERLDVARRLADRARATWLDATDGDGPDEAPAAPRAHSAMTAPSRFLLQAFWSLHDSAEWDTEALEGLVGGFRRLLPHEGAFVTAYPGHWVHACVDGADVFDRRCGARTTYARFVLHLEAGRLLWHADAVGASSELRIAVALARAQTGLSRDRPADVADLEAARASDPIAMRELAYALNFLGIALLESEEQGEEAVAVHQEELRLNRALAQLPLGRAPDGAELDAALARDPGAVRQLTGALEGLGRALLATRRSEEAVAVLREELRLTRALASLPVDRPLAGAELNAAIERDPDSIRQIALALNTLAIALRAVNKAEEAVAVHQEELRIKRTLARLPLDRPAAGSDLDEALARDPSAVRELSIALNALGGALGATQRAEEAVVVRQEGIQLARALSGLPLGRSADGIELDVALARGPDAVRGLAITLSNLGDALVSVQRPKEAIAVHQEALQLKRVLARLPRARPADNVEIDAALARNPRAVRELAIALNTLGVALESTQQAKEAVAVRQEALQLRRALARLPRDQPPDEADLDAAPSSDPDMVRELALALHHLGVALRAMRQTMDAVAAHQEGLRLIRALSRLPLDRFPDKTELDAALARDPAAVRALAIALNSLGVALESMQEAKEAVAVHQEALRLARALVPIPLDRCSAEAEHDAALAHDEDAVRGLVVALNGLVPRHSGSDRFRRPSSQPDRRELSGRSDRASRERARR